MAMPGRALSFSRKWRSAPRQPITRILSTFGRQSSSAARCEAGHSKSSFVSVGIAIAGKSREGGEESDGGDSGSRMRKSPLSATSPAALSIRTRRAWSRLE